MESSRATGLRTLLKAFSESTGHVRSSRDLDTEGLRRLGQFARDYCPEVPLRDLFPALDRVLLAVDGNFAVGTRLSNVLHRWRGMDWAPYLDVSSAQLLGRRNLGVRSLGELLWLAYRADRDAPTRPYEPPADQFGPLIGAADISGVPPADVGPAEDWSDSEPDPLAGQVLEALEAIVAWGRWERGLSMFPDVVADAFAGTDLPESVEAAVGTLKNADFTAWVSRGQGRHDPVAAVSEFWDQHDDAERLIGDLRLLPLEHVATLDDIGRTIGVSRERVRQREVRVVKGLAKLAARPGPCRRIAGELRRLIGAASEVEVLGEPMSPLRRLGIDPLSTIGLTLLRLAGPYELRSGWLIRRPALAVIGDTKGLLSRMVEAGPVPIARAEEALLEYGINESSVRPWIVSVGRFRIEGDVVVPWSGSMSDKAVVVLGLEQRPMTLEELANRLGSSTNLRSFANQLGADPRIKRTGIRRYGLRHWDHDEYTSVADEIGQEIDRQGGSATVDHLIQHLTDTYGVSEASVRANLSSPLFSRVDGHIERAPTPQRRETHKPPEMTRNMFRGSQGWALRVRITHDILRGSGFPVPIAFARELGLEPLSTAEFGDGDDRVSASWVGLQPTMGSIRGRLARAGAAEGDFAFVVRTQDGIALSVARSDRLAMLTGLSRLAAEMGLEESASLAALGTAVGIQVDDVDDVPAELLLARRFLARGEAELASLLDAEETDQIVISLDNARYVEVRWSH